MRVRSVVTLAVLAALVGVFACAPAALAAAPPTAPAAVQSVGFEDPVTDTLDTYAYEIQGSATSTASWGLISPRHNTGSYALWCAGTTPGSWPFYPQDTRGRADLTAQATSDFYESWVSFYYIMPTLGAGDSGSFSVRWYNAPKDPSVDTQDLTFSSYSITPVWTRVLLQRTGAGTNDLPAGPGALQFQFQNYWVGPEVHEGPTIDDVQVLGYKYGPVRSINASRGSPHTNVAVSWSRPYLSPGTTSVDSRSMIYRVWRYDTVTGSYTELAASPTSSLSITDTSAPLTGTLQYVVKAYDPADGALYGETATSTVVPSAPSTTLAEKHATTVATSVTIPYGGSAKLQARLANVDNAAISGASSAIYLQSSPDGTTWSSAGASIAESGTSPGTYETAVSPNATTYYRMGYSGTGGYSASIGTPVLQVSVRAATTSWASVLVTPSPVAYNGTVTASGSLVSETGAPVTGRTGLTVQRSPDGSTSWADTTATVTEDTPGHYIGSITGVKAGGYYRLRFPGSANFGASDSSASSVSLKAASASWSAPVATPSTVPYMGTATVGGTLSGETGLAVGLTDVVALVSPDNLFISPTTVPAVEDSPGHYTATLTSINRNAGSRTYVKLSHPADGLYDAALSSSTSILSQQASTSWQDLSADPAVVVSGGSSTISATLVGSGGPVVTGATVTVKRGTSPTGPWTNTTASEGSAGRYWISAPNITQRTYFQFYVGTNTNYATSTSANVEVTATVNPATTITANFAGTSATSVSTPVGAQTVVYGALKDSTSAPITGRAALVVVQTSPTGSVWTTATAGVASSTIESGTVPGTYAVTVTTPGVGLAYYRLSFGGVAPGYSPSQSSALQITGLKSNSSWSGVSAPASAPYGGSATYSATLSGDGGPLSGQAAAVTFQSSPDGSAWSAVAGSSVSEDSPAHYTVTVGGLTSAKHYRLSFAGNSNYNGSSSADTPIGIVEATTSWTSVPTSATVPYKGSTSIGGSLGSVTGSVAGRAARIVVQSSADGATGWATVSGTGVSEDSSAHYTATLGNLTAGAYYRLAYLGDAGMYAASSSSAMHVLVRQATTSFSGVALGSPSVAVGETASIGGALGSETGNVTGAAGSIVAESSANGTSGWTPVAGTSVAEDSPAHYVASFTAATAGSAYYRLRFAGDARYVASSSSPGLQLAVTPAASSWASGTVTPDAVSYGGSVVVSAKLQTAGASVLGGRGSLVHVLSSPDGTSWTTLPATIAENPSGVYSATVTNLTTDAYFRLAFDGDATYAASAWDSVKVSVGVTPPQFGATNVAGALVGYNALTWVYGVLTGPQAGGMVPLSGRTVYVQSSSTGAPGTWVNIAQATADPGTPGRYYAPVYTRSLTYYRLYFPASGIYLAGEGPISWVYPKASVGTPSCYSTVTHGRYFTVAGGLSPAHPTGGKVLIKAYRYENRRWRLKQQFWANAGTGTRYSARIKLKYAGSYRLYAYHADGTHLATTSGYRKVTAR